ncbi:purine-binding chemotaxis protein CheW [Vibrio cholerae]|nr:purine-binding chemotaxis protein CheW [Vibrio cholerae]
MINLRGMIVPIIDLRQRFGLTESMVVPFLSGILNVGDEVMSLLDSDALLDMDRILNEGQA